MFLRPFGFAFRKCKAITQAESIDLLFCLLESKLVVISHPDILLDIVIFLIRNIN